MTEQAPERPTEKDLEDIRTLFIGAWHTLGHHGPKLFAEIRSMREERDEAIRHSSDWARRAGEAEGALRACKEFHLVEGWKERASKAEKALLDERLARVNEYARADGLIHWINNPGRSPANTAFTEGPERQVAYAVEDLLLKAEARCKELLGQLQECAQDKEKVKHVAWEKEEAREAAIARAEKAEQSLRDSAAREAGIRHAWENFLFRLVNTYGGPSPYLHVEEMEEALSTPSPAADRLKLLERVVEASDKMRTMLANEYGRRGIEQVDEVVEYDEALTALRALDAKEGT